MITLYGLPLSSYTAKVRVALHWRGLSYQEREPEGGYRSAAWAERVPMGTLPALAHDGFFLAESEAILEYLEDAFTERPLLPSGAQPRAQVRMLARLHDLHVEPRVRALFPLIKDPAPHPRLPSYTQHCTTSSSAWRSSRRPAPSWPAISPAWPTAALLSPFPLPGACLRP